MAAKGTATLLMGPPGSGKTHALRTFVDAGVQVFIISTEPGIESTLGDTDKDKVHWARIFPADPSWDSLLDTATKINTLSNDALQKLPGLSKKEYFQFGELLGACKNFKCDRCGKEFGDIATWDTSRALVLDSLSGLNIMMMDMAVGAKPLKTLPDWGVAMDNEERFLMKLTNGVNCHVVVTAHITRETDEVMGGVKLMVSALGNKLAPKIPRFFSDVILAVRDGTKWSWDLASTSADVKARNLDWKSGLPPSFKPLIEAWKRKAA